VLYVAVCVMQDWLVTGRSPAPVAAAAVQLALRANHIAFDPVAIAAHLKIAKQYVDAFSALNVIRLI
jgi:hypothetical protein